MVGETDDVVQTYYTNQMLTTAIGGQPSTNVIQANTGFPTCLVNVARVLDGPQAEDARGNAATFEVMFPDVDRNEGLGEGSSLTPALVATVGTAAASSVSNPLPWAMLATPVCSNLSSSSSLAAPALLAEAFTGSPLQGSENFNLTQDAVTVATDAYGPKFGLNDLYVSAAFILVSVAEKAIGDATGTGNTAPFPPRLCWGCNGNHQWKDCNRRNDPVCIANFRRSVAEFRNNRTPPRYRNSNAGANASANPYAGQLIGWFLPRPSGQADGGSVPGRPAATSVASLLNNQPCGQHVSADHLDIPPFQA